jgi:hypothetical protein
VKNLARGGLTRKSQTFLFAGNTLQSIYGIYTDTMEKLMRGQASKGLLAKRAHPLGRKKPMRGTVSCWFRIWQETRTSAGYQTLKWRLRPTTRGLRHPKGCTTLLTGMSLKGTTPWTLPVRNKAGRKRVDQCLESVETLRRHRTWKVVSSGKYVAARFCKRRRGKNRKGGSRLQEKSCK